MKGYLADPERTAEAIVAVVEQIPGAEDVFTPRNEGALYYQLTVDRLAVGPASLERPQHVQSKRLPHGLRL